MMPEQKQETKKITPREVLNGESPCVLTATLKPVAGLDRFQPAGFPEVGHVIYRAPRGNGTVEQVCIVDSAASMANHLESVCMRGAHDYELVDELKGMPYLRCVTGAIGEDGRFGDDRETVVTSLTEGHRIASTYFLGARNKRTGKWDGKGGQRVCDGAISTASFGEELAGKFGVVLADSPKAHPPTQKWWDVFKTIFEYDPNALVHGVLFPQWQIKIPRVLAAHLEAFGAARVDRSGVKFDRLGKTTSGQPIFAVDDATAQEIHATFILDVALVRSFGRKKNEGANEKALGLADDQKEFLGLADKQKEFLVALALWKIGRLLGAPFRFRSGCHLQRVSLKQGESEAEIVVDIKDQVRSAAFRKGENGIPLLTDIFWPRDELYSREGTEGVGQTGDGSDQDVDGEDNQNE